MTERDKRLRRESKKFKAHVQAMILTLHGMDEDQAIDFLDGKDLIVANHCFATVFGHSIPAKYRQ